MNDRIDLRYPLLLILDVDAKGVRMTCSGGKCLGEEYFALAGVNFDFVNLGITISSSVQ